MKKLINIILCLVLLSISVLGSPSIETNETTNVGTEIFSISTGSNESSLINYTVLQGSTVIVQSIFPANDTDSIIIIGNLDGNTLYTWQVDYNSLGATTSIFNSVTTDNYQLRNTGTRILMGLLTLVYFAGVIGLAFKSAKDPKEFVGFVIMGLAIFVIIAGLLAV